MNTELAWFKSSYSSSGDGDCVEVATCPTTVHVRDSKLERSPQLAITSERWQSFLTYAIQH
ncbi:DUF397 domain-containing protein [Streptomyces sp. Z26]|uniref:DUF397 domain-containing protein n=1 Tax=Streptomyces sp. Z26 TaxID=2500177 RepID=UPI000EF1387A|nr:DUF397 domain-containing protein [Streptomyces sp. Z26]RLL69311.1 DUF397 domain-containing protein [Streptomyces sp. Z26]